MWKVRALLSLCLTLFVGEAASMDDVPLLFSQSVSDVAFTANGTVYDKSLIIAVDQLEGGLFVRLSTPSVRFVSERDRFEFDPSEDWDGQYYSCYLQSFFDPITEFRTTSPFPSVAVGGKAWWVLYVSIPAPSLTITPLTASSSTDSDDATVLPPLTFATSGDDYCLLSTLASASPMNVVCGVRPPTHPYLTPIGVTNRTLVHARFVDTTVCAKYTPTLSTGASRAPVGASTGTTATSPLTTTSTSSDLAPPSPASPPTAAYVVSGVGLATLQYDTSTQRWGVIAEACVLASSAVGRAVTPLRDDSRAGGGGGGVGRGTDRSEGRRRDVAVAVDTAAGASVGVGDSARVSATAAVSAKPSGGVFLPSIRGEVTWLAGRTVLGIGFGYGDGGEAHEVPSLQLAVGVVRHRGGDTASHGMGKEVEWEYVDAYNCAAMVVKLGADLRVRGGSDGGQGGGSEGAGSARQSSAARSHRAAHTAVSGSGDGDGGSGSGGSVLCIPLTASSSAASPSPAPVPLAGMSSFSQSLEVVVAPATPLSSVSLGKGAVPSGVGSPAASPATGEAPVVATTPSLSTKSSSTSVAGLVIVAHPTVSLGSTYILSAGSRSASFSPTALPSEGSAKASGVAVGGVRAATGGGARASRIAASASAQVTVTVAVEVDFSTLHVSAVRVLGGQSYPAIPPADVATLLRPVAVDPNSSGSGAPGYVYAGVCGGSGWGIGGDPTVSRTSSSLAGYCAVCGDGSCARSFVNGTYTLARDAFDYVEWWRSAAGVQWVIRRAATELPTGAVAVPGQSALRLDPSHLYLIGSGVRSIAHRAAPVGDSSHALRRVLFVLAAVILLVIGGGAVWTLVRRIRRNASGTQLTEQRVRWADQGNEAL